jgi:hypothetical protein
MYRLIGGINMLEDGAGTVPGASPANAQRLHRIAHAAQAARGDGPGAPAAVERELLLV